MGVESRGPNFGQTKCGLAWPLALLKLHRSCPARLDSWARRLQVKFGVLRRAALKPNSLLRGTYVQTGQRQHGLGSSSPSEQGGSSRAA